MESEFSQCPGFGRLAGLLENPPREEGSVRPPVRTPLLERREAYDPQQAMQQQRRQCHHRPERHNTFGELCMCTEDQIPRLARKHSRRTPRENRTPRMRRGRSSGCHGMGGATVLPPIHMGAASQAMLCPTSLQVGMELALLAAHLGNDQLEAPSNSNEEEAAASGPTACAPTGIAEQPQATEEPLCCLAEDAGRLSPGGGTTTRRGTFPVVGSDEGRSESRASCPAFPFHPGSTTVWRRLVRAYGLGEPPGPCLVELLLRQVSVLILIIRWMLSWEWYR